MVRKQYKLANNYFFRNTCFIIKRFQAELACRKLLSLCVMCIQYFQDEYLILSNSKKDDKKDKQF